MGVYRNPILPGCHPDPSICRVGDEYFLVTSTFEYLPALPLHRSRDLVDWELIGHAIHRPEQLDLRGLPSSRGLFAPTIRFHAGTFYIVCTVVPPDDRAWDGRSGHFIVTAQDAAGPWSDPVWIEGVGGIDPSLTFDGDRVWLCGTRVAEPLGWQGATEVWVVELDPDDLQVIGRPVVAWTGAVVHAVWAEGPHIMARPGGGWMLVAAEGGTSYDHAVVVAYAEEITGPFVGDPGNPRLTHRDLGAQSPIVAVGHADLVEATDGGTWAVALAVHTRDGLDSLQGRQTHLVPVGWEDRRPLFAPGVGRVALTGEVPGAADQQAAPASVHDDFEAATLDLNWNGVRRHPLVFADLAARPGWVRLSGAGEPGRVGDLSFLGRRLPAGVVRVETVIDVTGAGGSDGAIRGGLLLRTSEIDHLELAVDDRGHVRAVLAGEGGASILCELDGVDPSSTHLGLLIDGFTVSLLLGGELCATVDVRGLSPRPPTGFVGVWVGPFAVGHGVVDIDSVTMTIED